MLTRASVISGMNEEHENTIEFIELGEDTPKALQG